MFTLKDIKPFNRLKLRNENGAVQDTVIVILNKHNVMIVVYDDGQHKLEIYNKDLTYTYNSDYDIMEIYDSPDEEQYYFDKNIVGNLLWKREERFCDNSEKELLLRAAKKHEEQAKELYRKIAQL